MYLHSVPRGTVDYFVCTYVYLISLQTQATRALSCVLHDLRVPWNIASGTMREHGWDDGRARPARSLAIGCAHHRTACCSGYLCHRLARRANRLKPATDIDLRVRLSTEMPGCRTIRGCQVPLDDGELLVSAFDYIPVNRVIAGDPANLALKFLQT